ncbi:DUF892 family protein [Spirosoma rhododendri]|uniref:DUF892 family protein n=1 Tax=Spirosoma rhododendri TaxID=2728024 RepID=A0A7L5DKT4_9BACT|nr:DUF892 family protein [Spirosoma rhododendri]QJD79069.1 DUF892 family protein [Spirosoma rhododendri]
MENEPLTQLIKQGLGALKAGSQVAEQATSEIQNDVRDAQLTDALKKGNQTSQQWSARIDRALAEVGGSDQQENPVLEAHYEVSKKIRQQATDDISRDLGIIAAGQLALHYWIASFGTLGTYAAAAGLQQTEQDMNASLEEAKQADSEQTSIAQQILNKR